MRENQMNQKQVLSIAKAKVTLGLKNVSAPTSSKSVPTKNKELVSKIEEQKSVSSPTTYESPSLMLNGRLASGGKLKVDFKQTILTEEEKKFW